MSTSTRTPSRIATAGFTLVELLMVLALSTALIVAAYQAMRMRQQSQAADSYITLQAREMAEFARAVQSFAADNKASWTVNARQTITPAQLIAAGKLANTWAQRGGTAGVTPIGETYRAFAIKDNTGVVRIVTADFGRSATDSLVRRAGYQSAAESLQGYKARVADQMTKDFKGYAAYVAAGVTFARGPAGGFTQDLTAYFAGNPPALPVAVELVGWPEYRRPGDITPNTSGSFTCEVLPVERAPGASMGGYCHAPGFSTSIQQCDRFNPPATQLVYQPPVCPTRNGQTPQPSFRIPICGGGAGTVYRVAEGITISFGMTSRNREYNSHTWSDNCMWRLYGLSGSAAQSHPNRSFALIENVNVQYLQVNANEVGTVECGAVRQTVTDNNNQCSVQSEWKAPVLINGAYANNAWHQLPNTGSNTNEDRKSLVCCYSESN